MDVTDLIIEAQDARAKMQRAKKDAKEEVRRKYEAAMTREVAELSREAEYAFAQTLARVHAAGVKQGVLRKEVLRTNVWDIWTYWRDLAEIEPERVTIRNAKAERELAASPFRWAEDYSTLTVVKDSTGADIEPLVMRIEGLSTSHGSWYVPDGVSEDALVIARRDSGFMMMISDELKKALDNEWISQ